ncbi:unnamed protein product [Phaedon cochleariae]|uniref:Endonuclease-reverse transcriptase n=1 Tax=Phaedon cochleariae TaxID=80249 RepID=A0A9P0DPP5_PHACE|nr:unnamed protein product [Phaedon cochleariae]
MPQNDGNDISNKVLFDMLNNVITTNETIKKQNDEIKTEILNIKQELGTKIEELKEENSNLKKKVNSLKEKILACERKQKKYNLIFYGLNEKENQLEDIQNIIEVIKEHCGVPCTYQDLRNCYRIGQKKDSKTRPVLVEFIYYHQIGSILEKASNLKGSGISISKDFAHEDYQERKTLHHNLKAARRQNVEAKIVKNKLIVRGIEYSAEQLQLGDHPFIVPAVENTPSNGAIPRNKRKTSEAENSESEVTRKSTRPKRNP